MKSSPCPFCGEARPKVLRHRLLRGAFFVHCSMCKAHGPIGGSKDDAREQWNHRPTPDQAKAENKHFQKCLDAAFGPRSAQEVPDASIRS
jgi:Lar family restriction alleviation protein